MSTTNRLRNPGLWIAAALTAAFTLFAGTALADPPNRVARVSFLSGNVSFQPAGDDQWAQVSLNRPLVTGDRLYSDRDSRAELEIGGATIRLDEATTFGLLNLDDSIAQMELADGVMNLDVQYLAEGQIFEVDTPTLAFVVAQPGNYRIDIDPQGNSTMVTVFQGAGDVYGENNASYAVREGNSYRFNDSALRDYEILDLPHADDFDRWCSTRTSRYQGSVSRNYVPEGTIGYTDLDQYGSWSTAPDYGNVWYPTSVAVDWAPYRNGHWSWIDPWGWTWVDSAPWGFTPFHYGRWAYIGNRWGWCPGPRIGRAIYAPAMVAFVGGGGWGTSISVGIGSGPVGWFPLGPRDVYVPWYQTSRSYFTNINVRNTRVINNTYITNVYNDYSRGRPITNARYAYRTNAAALTAVPRAAFVGARQVAPARVQVNAANLRNAQVVSRIGIAPERASFVAANARTRTAPSARVMDRTVIARTAPPARAVPIATRLQAIQRNDARPLQASQMRELATARPAAGAAARAPARVQVVGQGNARPQPLPARGNAAATRPTPATQRANPTATRSGATSTPATRAPATTQGAVTRSRPATEARGALPSSRFAPRTRTTPAQPGATTPGQARTPATPATRAPAVRPAERSGSASTPARTAPAQRVAPRPGATPSTTTPAQSRPQPAQRQQVPSAASRTAPSTQRATPGRAPVQRDIRPAPQVREMPRNTAPATQRVQPQQRPAPQVQPRPAPQQRVQPQQQRPAPQQQRPAPQQRVQPQQQRPAPQQRAQPQARPAAQPRPQPQQRSRSRDDNKDDNRGRR